MTYLYKYVPKNLFNISNSMECFHMGLKTSYLMIIFQVQSQISIPSGTFDVEFTI